MSDGIERQIFEQSIQREEDLGKTDWDEAVESTIRSLDRQMPPEPKPSKPAAPAPATPPDVENSGLLKALLDERDRRQRTESRLERIEREQQERLAREQQPALSERLFSDPDGTIQQLRQEITAPLEQRLQQMSLDHSFALAQVRHGEAFGQAWQAWYEQVKDGQDATTYFTVMNSASPGEAMVQWYRRVQRDQEVGDDLEAYNQKVIEKYLAERGAAPPLPRNANGQFTPRPQAPQRTPTSLSRMGSSAADEDDEAGDGSDAAIFAASRPPRRSRR